MEVYTVTVATGTAQYSGTNNYIFVTLVGEKGESERTLLDNPGLDFCRGAVDQYKVISPFPLGSLLLVRLEKQRYWVEDNWFCRYVTVEPPGGDKVTFPCYRWLIGDVRVEIREGTAKTLRDDSSAQLLAHRKTELQERQKIYRWVTWAPGIPRCIDAKTEADLPQDVRFENEKKSDFEHSLHYALVELSLKKLAIRFGKSWNDLDDFKRIFWKLRSPIAEYCMEHWKEDWFFGYQCLNGSNPRMIHRCKKLPENFPVMSDMVQSSMAPRTNLDIELKAGNIYLLDYAIMDGIPTNTIKARPQYIAAPLCLLYQHPDEGLIPIAIQIEQTPGLDTPIFLPRDPPLAWLLAKMWVRHSEFQVFQLLSHLLRTHLVIEVFCVATLRQLPAVHPIYKLLAPHLRYTLEINCRGRTQLISANGIFKRVVSTGGDGLLILAQREYKMLTYRSLQPCNDFTDREVSQLPNYFYREHSLMLWEAIHSFVLGMVSLYYQSDHDVQEDLELQAWIKDISQEGFTELPDFGLPSKFSTREELSTLLAVAIFTSTAQHAATNNGQFDWCAWVPNTPCTMRQPPPTDKDAVTMEMIMATLPDVSQSCLQMAITWHLGRAQPDAIPLGQYTEQHFTEGQAVELIDRFRTELKEIESHIWSQNKGLELQYLFLLPSRIENSITI
ncbi:arachidonate 12-lipoxygenase, 12S-type [Xiphias gladius]|uniref:arachidonate 12-lipoxygenase, 12S-type n=1 Tax=Xiphias gladius TaxID=8245 RepID=UPI001A984A27|nr:arachidonate 12-lipoxygenase, 12S-type [Xiphias gladius]XP_039996999.1 arachidonate 12-lipoxygenase, 12S-type [Xiphias gladius]XP_039997001.1 arachidonate 12-lipoxygenase, 12S-type [Xiphias gladius]XP_039997002.1 arachidonate 12-lipoxygenase, 12S-type [Xiphias gladius]XP_039997003.1 arachidonate 12-lipoxygenase, 12S-type [Xiphias gladius]XP_039997004.1 arachidonate 12-lipoxygenase, 12S-type [Xiphias gladius]